MTGLTITETLYDTTLNPVHAEVKLQLKVLTPAELQAAGADSDVLAKVATVAYEYTLSVRQVSGARQSRQRRPIDHRDAPALKERTIQYPPTSRYYGATTYQAITTSGLIVTALVMPASRSPLPIGYHPRAERRSARHAGGALPERFRPASGGCVTPTTRWCPARSSSAP